MHAPWSSRRAAAVAAGGLVGAVTRWAVLEVFEVRGDFSWPILALNLGGSFVLGVVLAEEWTHPRAHLLLHDAAGIGFCGGLTTFSTFALEVARLLDDGASGMALSYLGVSMTGAVLAVTIGAAMFHRVRALTLPLEEEP